MGEDIADNGGVRRSYRAFKAAWSREQGNVATLPGLPEFSPDQLFFLGYATVSSVLAAYWYFDTNMKIIPGSTESSKYYACIQTAVAHGLALPAAWLAGHHSDAASKHSLCYFRSFSE